jgi:phosphoglycolate phosphatase
LAGVFGAVVAGDTLSVRKPDPAPLLHALAGLGVSGGLYVGDSPVDSETARRAGVPFALFTEGIREAPLAEIPHDAAFSDMRELPDIYAALTGD